MALPDFTNYTDEKLEDARLAILNEQERRVRLAQIPLNIRADVQRYVEDGGDRADLLAAVNEPVAEPVEPDPEPAGD